MKVGIIKQRRPINERMIELKIMRNSDSCFLLLTAYRTVSEWKSLLLLTVIFISTFYTSILNREPSKCCDSKCAFHLSSQEGEQLHNFPTHDLDLCVSSASRRCLFSFSQSLSIYFNKLSPFCVARVLAREKRTTRKSTRDSSRFKTFRSSSWLLCTRATNLKVN